MVEGRAEPGGAGAAGPSGRADAPVPAWVCPPRGVGSPAMAHGREWIVDAFECTPARIAGETGREALMSLFANVVRSVNLHPVGQAVWQLVGGAGAVTGMLALVESHLTCHSDPGSAYLSVNLLSHRTEMQPDWDGLLTRFVGARRIQVRVLERGLPAAPPERPAESLRAEASAAASPAAPPAAAPAAPAASVASAATPAGR